MTPARKPRSRAYPPSRAGFAIGLVLSVANATSCSVKPAAAPIESASKASARAGVLRIMPLGDSITQATCYRAVLWQRLDQSFAGRFDFVGGVDSDAGCSPAHYDRDNEGHSGSLVTNIVAGVVVPPGAPTLNDLRASFAAHLMDVVLMHFGTNDVWNAVDPRRILDAYSSVVDALRNVNPNVTVLVAQLIAMNPINTASCPACACPACGDRVLALNAAIPSWAASKSLPGSPVTVVDQWSGFDTGADTVDGVHPNSTTGAQKMAERWYTALAPLF